MSISTSVLGALLQARPQLKPQVYFKSSLTALSHAMEDQVLAGGSDYPLVIASFQQERFYRQEAHRYRRIAELTDQVYVLAAPETDFTECSDTYETIAFQPADQLSQEWHLVVIGQHYASCLVCRERGSTRTALRSLELPAMDQTRQFEGIWTFDRAVSRAAAGLLLKRITYYQPDLQSKVSQALATYGIQADSSAEKGEKRSPATLSPGAAVSSPAPFVERLVTYLQAGQYKLLRAYRSIAAQEQRERLVNFITTAIRQSLDPDEILRAAVQELGQSLQVCRCLIYRCRETDATATIQYEFLGASVPSLQGQVWSIQANPLFQEALQQQAWVYVAATRSDPRLADALLQDLVQQWQIDAWLLVPVLYQGRLLGIVELHHCNDCPVRWQEEAPALVEAIAAQIGVALIQAEAYANLEDLNQQLAALDRTRSNLIAITGHELRTPLSTIQVCLESLASEPDMPNEMRQVMLSSALSDAERLRELVGDFLTLSQLESGRVEWHLEPLSLHECVELSLSGLRARQSQEELPKITLDVPPGLPLVQADGEWLVEVLTKLLDNACKFTDSEGEVTIYAHQNGSEMLEVTVADTGRGIEPKRLEVIFDRFYQEEGALRRTTGGTGLGLTICRQIINSLGGRIWAESAGKDQGSAFHFTVPTVDRSDGVRSNSRTREPNLTSPPGMLKQSARRRHRAR